jgi:radical SAM superfamily enzyme YgiQ (UPF0313 family)
MRVCLAGSPTVTEFEETAEAESEQVREVSAEPQLGILSLAAVLEAQGCPVEAVDLNRLYYSYLPEREGGVDFSRWAAPKLVARGADVYGLSSICSSYPLTLRLASEIKRLHPDAVIVAGGPQASVVDRETLQTFPFVDFVLRGEADRTLPQFLDELDGKKRWQRVPGLTFRDGDRVLRNANAPVVEPLDELPVPAYHQIENIHELDYLSLELGRGCPFACKFCSTNDFFRRRFRVKSPGRMLAEMRQMSAQYGFRRFDLIHDMFTVDRKRVAAFCGELLASGENFIWSCSARTDCIDEELLELMAAAGCKGVFFGVESGSERMQRLIDKHLDIPKSRAMVDAAERFGIETTVSLIAGFPDEEEEDLRDTVHFFMHAVRTPGASPQLNLLAPLAATPLHAQFKEQMVLDDLCSDISHQGRFQNVVDRLLIETHPDLFPNFYLLPTPHLDRPYVLELREFLLMANSRFPWLLAALHQASGSILTVFSEWRDGRLRRDPGVKGSDLRYYYRLRTFRDHFSEFLRPRLAKWKTPSVEALFAYESALREAIAREEIMIVPERCTLWTGAPRDFDRPMRARQVYTFALDWDIEAVVSALQRDAEPDAAAAKRFCYATRPSSQERSALIKIGELARFVLECCTGELSVLEIAKAAEDLVVERNAPPALLTCLSLVQALASQGYLVMYRPEKQRTYGRAARRPASGAIPLPAVRLAAPAVPS